MRLGLDVLRRFVDLPEEPHTVRRWLDEQGVEVKRVEHDDAGTVFALELLANRGDHYCYEGVARELDGALGRGLTLPEVAELEVGESPWPLRCETEQCLVYTATLLQRSEDAGALGPSALRVIEAAQVHSLEAPVDASNIANLELGQPTHAFDADTLVGPVTIRLSRVGETALPLFAEERVELPEGTLVIADDEKILAVAGVIGCEESKTTRETTRMLLESATFDPVAVRKASRALGLHTDSSARFERGSDPARPLVGAGRVVHLLEATTAWRRSGTTGVVGDWSDPGRQIPLSVSSASRFLEVDLAPPDVVERLGRYGFECTGSGDALSVRVPPWRLWDVHEVDDLYEELAKSVGYENTPVTIPIATLGAPPSAEEARRDRVEEVLLGYGFYEVFTDGFYSRKARELLGVTEGHPLHAHVETTNALERGYALLKNNALHQALEAASINERRRTLRGRMYEWTRTFHPRPDPPAPPDRTRPVCDERDLLWAMAFSDDAAPTWSPSATDGGVWLLKGIVEELAIELGLELVVGRAPVSEPLADLLHPGRSAVITMHGDVVGVLGEVHPAVRRRYRLKSVRPCYLELDRSALVSPGTRPAYTEPPVHQPIERSLAFEVPRGIEAGQILTALSHAAPEWLTDARVTDVFPLAEGRASVTFRLTFSNDDNQRTAEEVNQATESMVAAVTSGFDGSVLQR